MSEFNNEPPLSPNDVRERNIRRAVVGVAVLLLAGLIALVVVHGSNNDNPKVADSSDSSSSTSSSIALTTTSIKSSTTAVAPSASSACGATGSSPATFNESGGLYAMFISSVDLSAKTISFDVIQFLTGDDANTAYKKDNPSSTDSAPDDYYIVNSSKQLYTLKYVDNVIVDTTSGSAEPEASSVGALNGLIASGLNKSQPFWVRVSSNYVQGICEQFVP